LREDFFLLWADVLAVGSVEVVVVVVVGLVVDVPVLVVPVLVVPVVVPPGGPPGPCPPVHAQATPPPQARETIVAAAATELR
jgi:hypothetical protein